MMTTLQSPADLQETDSGHCPRFESLLVKQLAQATRELRFLEAEGRRTDLVRAVVRSLRKTLARMAERGSMLESGSSEILIKGRGGDEVELWHGGTRVPVEIQPLRDALQSGGVALEPGQVLLADPELTRQVIEESLVRCSLQEFRLRETKSRLLRTLVDLPGLPARAS